MENDKSVDITPRELLDQLIEEIGPDRVLRLAQIAIAQKTLEEAERERWRSVHEAAMGPHGRNHY